MRMDAVMELLEFEEAMEKYVERNEQSILRCMGKHWNKMLRKMTKEEQDEYWELQWYQKHGMPYHD